jgi:hypothetical protein
MEEILTKEEGLKYYNYDDNNYREDLKDEKILISDPYSNIMINENLFRNIYELSFFHCDGIKDVSLLGNLHTLTLAYCVNIVDVSALGNVHTLDLSGCKKIKDISALKNVHELNISSCRRIKNIGKLNIEKLTLTNIIE